MRHLYFLWRVNRGDLWLHGWDEPALNRQCHCGRRSLNNGRLLFIVFFLFFFFEECASLTGPEQQSLQNHPQLRRRSGALLWICNFSPPTPTLERSWGAAPLLPPTHLIFIVSSCPRRSSFPGALLRRCLPSSPLSSHLSFFSHCHA